MSNFELHDEGEGRFVLQGDMSFETAHQILKASEPIFAQHTSIQVNLSKVGTADSAGLALLLEWKAQVAARGASIQFIGMPDSLASVARTSEVTDLL